MKIKMNKDGLINPNLPSPPAVEPEKKVVKKKNDIVERKDQRIFTEDGRELLD